MASRFETDDHGNVVAAFDANGNQLAEGTAAARMFAKVKAEQIERRVALLEREHPEHALLARTVQSYRRQAACLRRTARRTRPMSWQQPRSREHRSCRSRRSARRSSARSGGGGSDPGGGGSDGEGAGAGLGAHPTQIGGRR